MLFDDSPRANFVDVGVPYILRVDHNHWTVAALIHAAGVIDPHGTTIARRGDLFFQYRVHLE
jgi:hypothetical protein